MTDKPYDELYWGQTGIDLSRWGSECARGIRYKDLGVVQDGQAGAIRKISTGRKKYRGMASESILKEQKGEK
jgi:hypothetical protein